MPTGSASVPHQRTSTQRRLIVARMNPDDIGAVADVFAESDAGGLPRVAGIVRRDVFHFHGLYLHLIESRAEPGGTAPPNRDHPLFVELHERLGPYISAYDPQPTPVPGAGAARGFYTWVAEQHGP